MPDFSTVSRLDLKARFEKEFPADICALVLDAARLAEERKQPAVIVGGVVRDMLLGRPHFDLDVMVEPPSDPFVDALAERSKSLVTRHKQFLTFTLHLPSKRKMDIVTARDERYPFSAVLPVVAPSTIEKDLKRRDFTINAMAAWLDAPRFGEILDPFNGRSDLSKGLIRVLHAGSFVDDPTRVYRAARFAARLGFQLEKGTQALVDKAVRDALPSKLSPVRRRHEFELIMKEKNPLPVLELLETWGALKLIHEEWTVRAEHRRAFAQDGGNLLLEWFKPWGLDKARQMMTDLGFEKTVKKEVLSRL